MHRSARLNLNGDAGPAGAAIHTFLCRRPSREEGAWGPGPGQLQPREGEGGRAPPHGSRRSGVCGQRSRAAADRAPGRGAHHPPGPHILPHSRSTCGCSLVEEAVMTVPPWPSPRGRRPVAAAPRLSLWVSLHGQTPGTRTWQFASGQASGAPRWADLGPAQHTVRAQAHESDPVELSDSLQEQNPLPPSTHL